ncbi:PREDICTED: insulin-like growth factor-binding protein complex acid labile subunit [Nicrophorus vespilloides]|uniref:Insulin-like growth factor-binding protein complex acid labile subunit n=1 Tax=Nicrophorus vespilloides TaxID=110193 RepID=A0ABM1M458_NICVS|nr:PREDICTED: insulin-like growth factor-binding protein complex acid labile subunit [Nicrophorus vespilloides]XP_017769359.1 PREDICTED: insulin-like growth factor-binding protein complex acid labile subunit [Nicrophorus vespilloides]
MELWFTLFIIVISSTQTRQCCTSKKTPGSTEQLVCVNVTTHYMESLRINRTDKLVCQGCHLNTLTSAALNFTPNRLHLLYLSSAQMHRIEDNAFSKLVQLKKLLLRKNHLTEVNEKTFIGLRMLIQLDLSNNMIEILPDDVFKPMLYLDLLNLNENLIRDLRPRCFNNLSYLKYLYLNNNDIESVDPYIFKYMTSLKIIYLENNRIKELSPLAFANLNNLVFMYLNNNSLERLSDYNFVKLTNLVDLQLRMNSISSIPASCFNGLRKLKYLYLGDNNISRLEVHSFTGLDSLNVLDLLHNEIREFSLDYLGGTPELNVIWMEGNAIRVLDSGDFGAVLQNLKSFDVQMNQLEWFNYKLLHKKLPSLKNLIVGGNLFKCEFLLPMMDYFDGVNATLCVDYGCNETDIYELADTLCNTAFYNESIDSGDSGAQTFNFLLVKFYLFVYFVDFCFAFSFS